MSIYVFADLPGRKITGSDRYADNSMVRRLKPPKKQKTLKKNPIVMSVHIQTRAAYRASAHRKRKQHLNLTLRTPRWFSTTPQPLTKTLPSSSVNTFGDNDRLRRPAGALPWRLLRGHHLSCRRMRRRRRSTQRVTIEINNPKVWQFLVFGWGKCI